MVKMRTLPGLSSIRKSVAGYVMRIAGSLCARLIALVAIVGKVISSADNVSIVKIIPTVRPATASTSNLTAVPSVAVSKLISLWTWMSVATGDTPAVQQWLRTSRKNHNPLLSFKLRNRRTRRNEEVNSKAEIGVATLR